MPRVKSRCVEVLNLAVGVGAPAASFFALQGHGSAPCGAELFHLSRYFGSSIFSPRCIGRVPRKFTSSHIFTRAPDFADLGFQPAGLGLRRPAR